MAQTKGEHFHRVILSLNTLWPQSNSPSLQAPPFHSPVHSSMHYLKILRWTVAMMGFEFATLAQSIASPVGHKVILTLELDHPASLTLLIKNLKLLGLPVTVFLKTDQLAPSTDANSDGRDTHFSKALLQSYLDAGWEIGTMGLNLMDLTNLAQGQQLKCLSEVKEVFTDALGFSPKTFLYPLGAYDAATVSSLKQLNFVAGITSIEGVNTHSHDEQFHLKRLFGRSNIAAEVFSLVKHIRQHSPSHGGSPEPLPDYTLGISTRIIF